MLSKSLSEDEAFEAFKRLREKGKSFTQVSMMLFDWSVSLLQRFEKRLGEERSAKYKS